MNTLEIKNLTKKFGDFIAVDNMSLSIKEGEIFGFLGSNGAGKSTTINMIAGLLRSNEGEISILGKNIKKHNRFAKMNIGIVPQDIAIYEELTAYENVKFFAGLYGLRGAELKARVEEALQFVGLSDKQKSYPKNFSGGMKRRLNIACAIAHKQKTAYAMVVCDWSSDVCSSDLQLHKRYSVFASSHQKSSSDSFSVYH